jgi:hypothetical protein
MWPTGRCQHLVGKVWGDDIEKELGNAVETADRAMVCRFPRFEQPGVTGKRMAWWRIWVDR